MKVELTEVQQILEDTSDLMQKHGVKPKTDEEWERFITLNYSLTSYIVDRMEGRA